MTSRFMFIGATATALVLSCDLSPSALAQSGVASHQKADTLAPRRTRRSNPLVPFEAFGALAGAITSIAAAEHERETYGPYYSPSYAPHVVGRLRQTPPLITRPVSGTP